MISKVHYMVSTTYVAIASCINTDKCTCVEFDYLSLVTIHCYGYISKVIIQSCMAPDGGVYVDCSYHTLMTNIALHLL